MPLDSNLLERLLHEEEGSALDFKRDQYAFEGADGSQSLDLQREALRAEGIDEPANLYHDFASGGRDDRPGLDSCLGALRKGDGLVVWKLGRLGRPRSLGEGRSRSRRPHPSSASDSTRRTRSACREMECFW